MESTDIFLDSEDSGVRQVTIAPVVLFNILDHFIRRTESKQRVIGSLLGKLTSTNVLQITDSFPLPHSETGDDEVAVESDYFNKMHSLQRRVGTEVLVGWYATGSQTDLKSIIIHEFYARQCSNPVHVLLDTALTGDRMDVRAFISSNFKIGAMNLSSELTSLPVVVKANKAERVGLDALLNLKAEGEKEGDVELLEGSLKKLLDVLHTVGANVDAVVTGKIEGDVQTGKFLAETLTMVPRMNHSEFERLFGDNMRDLLMVTYVCKLAKSQLAVGEKLLGIDVPSQTPNVPLIQSASAPVQSGQTPAVQ